MNDQWPEKDLFGKTITDMEKVFGAKESPLKGRKLVTAYPAEPGTGPSGETCKTCKFKVKIRMGGVWYKCEKMRPHWSCSARTDIKMRSAACSYFEGRSQT